jgi:hypothetical protein
MKKKVYFIRGLPIIAPADWHFRHLTSMVCIRSLQYRHSRRLCGYGGNAKGCRSNFGHGGRTQI